MKKLSLLFLSALLVFTSCDNDDNADALTEADVARIVAAALADANIPSSTQIASEVTTAVIAAIDSGISVEEAVAQALAAQNANTVEEVGATGEITKLTGTINWTSDTTYIIGGKVVVMDGATLNIEAGTLVKARSGLFNDATALIIARGGTINANGTAAAPIVMTDINDQLTRQDIANRRVVSSNRTASDRGKWGGLIVLGKALISHEGGEERPIEGIDPPAGETWNKYGGSDDADNSGTISYVSIRHTGISLAPGNEIQGLTLGGVGSGTTINHVECFGSDDDGIEIFGGSVNLSNVVVTGAKDDSLDTDEGWSGTIDNAVIEILDYTDNAFEYDGPRAALGRKNVTQNVTVNIRYSGANTSEDTPQLGQLKENLSSTFNNILVNVAAGREADSGLESMKNNHGTYKGVATGVHQSFGTAAAGTEYIIFDDFTYIGASTQAQIVGGNTVDSSGYTDVNTAFASWCTILADRSSLVGSEGADPDEFGGWTAWSASF